MSLYDDAGKYGLVYRMSFQIHTSIRSTLLTGDAYVRILLIEHEQSPMLQHVSHCDLLMATRSSLSAFNILTDLGMQCLKSAIQCIASCAFSKQACKGCSRACLKVSSSLM